jgi:hypothetical protein
MIGFLGICPEPIMVEPQTACKNQVVKNIAASVAA